MIPQPRYARRGLTSRDCRPGPSLLMNHGPASLVQNRRYHDGWTYPIGKAALLREGGRAAVTSKRVESACSQEIVDSVVKGRPSRDVIFAPMRHKDHQTLPRARQKHSVGIGQISAAYAIDRLPTRPLEAPSLPVGTATQVGVPAKACPIQLKALDIKFSCSIF